MNSDRYTLTSIASTFAGMSLNDLAQLIAFLIAITSGLLAVRHYWFSTKLAQLKLKQLQEKTYEPKTKSHD